MAAVDTFLRGFELGTNRRQLDRNNRIQEEQLALEEELRQYTGAARNMAFALTAEDGSKLTLHEAMKDPRRAKTIGGVLNNPLFADLRNPQKGVTARVTGAAPGTEPGKSVLRVAQFDESTGEKISEGPLTENRTADDNDPIVQQAPEDVLAIIEDQIRNKVVGYSEFETNARKIGAKVKSLETIFKEAPTPENTAPASNVPTTPRPATAPTFTKAAPSSLDELPAVGGGEEDGIPLDISLSSEHPSPPPRRTSQVVPRFDPNTIPTEDKIPPFTSKLGNPDLDPTFLQQAADRTVPKVSPGQDFSQVPDPSIQDTSPTRVAQSTPSVAPSATADRSVEKKVRDVSRRMPKDSDVRNTVGARAVEVVRSVVAKRPGGRLTKEQKKALITLHTLDPKTVPFEVLARAVKTGRLTKSNLQAISLGNGAVATFDPESGQFGSFKQFPVRMGKSGVNALKSIKDKLAAAKSVRDFSDGIVDLFYPDEKKQGRQRTKLTSQIETSLSAMGLDPTDSATRPVIIRSVEMMHKFASDNDGFFGIGSDDREFPSITPFIVAQQLNKDPTVIVKNYYDPLSKALQDKGVNVTEVQQSRMSVMVDKLEKSGIPHEDALRRVTALVLQNLGN